MIEIELPDGAIAEFPDGTSHEVITGVLQKRFAPKAEPPMQSAIPVNSLDPMQQKQLQGIKDLIGGAARGAGSIGATLFTPYDKLAGNTQSWGNPERRAAMDKGLQLMGVDTQSIPFKGGKIASEVAGTLPVGGLLGKGAEALGATPKIVSALESGGFQLGQKGSFLPDMLLRTGAGATVGSAQAGLVNPNDAAAGAMIGGAAPGVAAVAGKAGQFVSDKAKAWAQSLMQSAIKPTIKQLRTGEAKTAVDVLLKHGINPTEGGVEKLGALIDDTDQALSNAIGNSNATVSKQTVLNHLNQTKADFATQVNPLSDMAAIENVGTEFAQHPQLPSDNIPVQLAQDLKRGTYQVLKGKYGEAGSASTEAQKALARGLKEEIANAVPEVSPLNAELSDLIKAKNVAERRALMSGNLNPTGLAALAKNPLSAGAFLLDRSSLAKSLLARGVNRAADPLAGIGALENLSPQLRSAMVTLLANPNTQQ